jgi:hypothetical protein
LTVNGTINSNPTGRLVALNSGNNPSVTVYDTAQNMASGLFFGSGSYICLGLMDGNGNYVGPWYQQWAHDGSSSSVYGTLYAPTIIASNNIQCNVSGNALLYLTSSGVRQWYIGAINNGYLYITDNSVGIARIIIDTNGFITCQGPTSSGNISVPGWGITYSGRSNNSWSMFWNGSAYMYVDSSQLGIIQFAPSDQRLKINIDAPKGDALSEIRALQLQSYDIPDRVTPDRPARHYNYGFSAQQVESVIPEAVAKAPYLPDPTRGPDDYSDDELMRSLEFLPIVARLVGAVQQLSSRLEALEGVRQ